MSRKRVGTVTHYFDQINVAVLSLNKAIRVGDALHFLGHATDFKQEVTSMQIEHKAVDSAKPGDDVALQVVQRVRPNDAVFKVEPE